jgi:hypothetical protein
VRGEYSVNNHYILIATRYTEHAKVSSVKLQVVFWYVWRCTHKEDSVGKMYQKRCAPNKISCSKYLDETAVSGESCKINYVGLFYVCEG